MGENEQGKLTTRTLLNKLREIYGPPRFAFFSEVCLSFASQQRADALAINLSRSRQFEIHGFEIKVERGDWISELRNPEKADHAFRYCDFWWLVISDMKIIKAEELPRGWGLLVPKNEFLFPEVKPERLSPDPINRDFMATLLRRGFIVAATTGRLQTAFQKGRTYEAEINRPVTPTQLLQSARAEAAHMRRVMQKFTEASGGILCEGNANELGGIVRRAMLKTAEIGEKPGYGETPRDENKNMNIVPRPPGEMETIKDLIKSQLAAYTTHIEPQADPLRGPFVPDEMGLATWRDWTRHICSGPPGFMSTADLAKMLNVTPRTLARWKELGLAPPRTQILRTVFYKITDVETWLENRGDAARRAFKRAEARKFGGRKSHGVAIQREEGMTLEIYDNKNRPLWSC